MLSWPYVSPKRVTRSAADFLGDAEADADLVLEEEAREGVASREVRSRFADCDEDEEKGSPCLNLSIGSLVCDLERATDLPLEEEEERLSFPPRKSDRPCLELVFVALLE